MSPRGRSRRGPQKNKLRIPKAKYIFITGGVVSSLGKGIMAASLALMLKSRGYKVTTLKSDPYLNVDPGTMNPFQHGEVYVTDDGAETDLDLGHYERFTGISMTRLNNVTSGQIYESVIQKERDGEYLGGTVQVIPHVTDEIISNIALLAKQTPKPEIVIVEVGGTVGDYESLPFFEAFRQFKQKVGPRDVLFIHLTLLPYVAAAGELKTKPTQHSVNKLREIGLQPDIIGLRTQHPVSEDIKQKIALFCSVDVKDVVAVQDAKSIYEVPLMLEEEGLARSVMSKLSLKARKPNMTEWAKLVDRIRKPSKTIKVALCGKYVELQDAYKSITEAFIHAGAKCDARVEVKRIEAEDVEKFGPEEVFKDVHGILVPGGFGTRGTEGKIIAAKYARENKIPYFGICLGMQIAVIEFARNVADLKNANSSEFRRTRYPVIDLMPGQRRLRQKGGTMRLGAWACHLKRGTKAFEAYGQELIHERHRHRYEFNNKYEQILTENGMIISGVNPDEGLVEMIELKDHPWFVACQFHPELKSRLTDVHPLFYRFIDASIKHQDGNGGTVEAVEPTEPEEGQATEGA